MRFFLLDGTLGPDFLCTDDCRRKAAKLLGSLGFQMCLLCQSRVTWQQLSSWRVCIHDIPRSQWQWILQVECFHSTMSSFINTAAAVLGVLALGALLFSYNEGGMGRESENRSNGFYLNPMRTWVLIASWFLTGENWNSSSTKPFHSALSRMISKSINIQYWE